MVEPAAHHDWVSVGEKDEARRYHREIAWSPEDDAIIASVLEAQGFGTHGATRGTPLRLRMQSSPS